MKNSMKILVVIGIIVAMVLIFAIVYVSIYNKLVRLDEEINADWSNVDVNLQRRFDLIPNLVESVKGAMKQEQEVFGAISDARAKMAGAGTANEKVEASNELEGALGRLLVVMENYPELKSSENVTGLMDELAGTENRIAVARTRYNDSVKLYNRTIRSFPANIIAGRLGFEARTQFEAVSGAEQAPSVSF